jgi:hypothetical protein
MKMKHVLQAVVLGMFLIPATIFAQSSYITVSDDDLYEANDIGTNSIYVEGQFSVDNGYIRYWKAGYGYYIYDIANSTLSTPTQPNNVMTNGYGDPFGIYDAANGCFYAGTYYDADESYLYKYTVSTSTWTALGSAINMYGAAIYNGNLYISGLNVPWNGGYGQDTYISIFNAADPTKHDCIAQTSGNSAYLAFDPSGNLYYATFGTSPTLYKWTAAEVASKIDILNNSNATDYYLTLADADKLTNLPDGANGIAADANGDVFVTVNSSTNHLLLVHKHTDSTGDDNYYTEIGSDSGGWYSWFGPLVIHGKFFGDDGTNANRAPLYGSFGWGGPVTRIDYVY